MWWMLMTYHIQILYIHIAATRKWDQAMVNSKVGSDALPQHRELWLQSLYYSLASWLFTYSTSLIARSVNCEWFRVEARDKHTAAHSRSPVLLLHTSHSRLDNGIGGFKICYFKVALATTPVSQVTHSCSGDAEKEMATSFLLFVKVKKILNMLVPEELKSKHGQDWQIIGPPTCDF